MKATKAESMANPKCLRCGEEKERFAGRVICIPFTQPNRMFDPEIFRVEITNIACISCLDEFKAAFTNWWQSKPPLAKETNHRRKRTNGRPKK